MTALQKYFDQYERRIEAVEVKEKAEAEAKEKAEREKAEREKAEREKAEKKKRRKNRNCPQWIKSEKTDSFIIFRAVLLCRSSPFDSVA